MLKKPIFRTIHNSLGSLLLILVITAFGSAANAQGDAPTQLETPDPATNSTSTTGENSGLCERPEQWLWAETYQKGDMTFHGSKVWKAIEKTSGDMPGMNEPPLWELVDDHCFMVDQ
ncbi:hypothetical protein [Marinobacter sp.]|uniref:hypothetical protein n=1 Tax=Marinobacter sp. TaxID=50741 RepID=UPI003A8D6D1D